MKKLTAFLLALLLPAALCLSAAAFEPSADKTLTQLTEIPDINSLISVGLPTSSVYSKPGTSDALSDAEIADVGDVRYGISLIGVAKSLQRALSSASDGVWTNYNKGGMVLENGMWSNGCVTWMTNADTYYNVAGQTGQQDSIYVSLLTYNFGKVMELQAFGYFTNNWNAFPRAVDVYVSNDAESWELVGKYDGNLLRMNGEEFISAGAASPADALEGTTNVNPLWSLEGHSAQYLRIAIVKGCGNVGENAEGNYDGYSSNPATVAIATREVVVFGVDPNPEVPPHWEEVIPDNPGEENPDDTDDASNPDDPDDPQPPEQSGSACDETEESPEPTSEPEPTQSDGEGSSDAGGTDADAASGSGCASAVAAPAGAVLLLGAAVVSRRRRDRKAGPEARRNP